MAVTIQCPTCGGTGVQTLGMDLHEALRLADDVEETPGWHFGALRQLTYPQGGRAFVVTAVHDQSGLQAEVYAPEFWAEDRRATLLTNPVTRR